MSVCHCVCVFVCVPVHVYVCFTRQREWSTLCKWCAHLYALSHCWKFFGQELMS